jgi:ribosomal protein S18 acetylase RimI-like enzyme
LTIFSLTKINTKLALTSWFFHSYDQQSATNAAEQVGWQFHIRTTTPTDLADVAQIIAEGFHSQKGFWGWAFPLLRLGIYEDLRHRLGSSAPHHVCLVAVDTTAGANKIVGTVELGIRFSNSWSHPGRTLPYLSNLAVHPKYRRHGVASGLLNSCEQFCLDWGFQDLYLHVLENNHQARQLYFKLGYRVQQVESYWNAFFLSPSRQILLHKHLIPNSNISID